MKRALRIVHFDSQKKAKALELSFNDAEINSKGYSDDGSLLISIQGEQRVAFQLSVAEAALLKERLDFVLALLTKQYIEVDSKVREKKGKKEKEEPNAGEETWNEELEGEEE